MKYALILTAIMTTMLSAPAFGDDGYIPQSTLGAFGLAEMETVSDDEGMQVRGRSAGSAITISRSMVAGLLMHPNTKSFVFGSDVNSARASLQASCIIRNPDPISTTVSGVGLSLNVDTGLDTFNGLLIGGAGGTAFALPF